MQRCYRSNCIFDYIGTKRLLAIINSTRMYRKKNLKVSHNVFITEPPHCPMFVYYIVYIIIIYIYITLTSLGNRARLISNGGSWNQQQQQQQKKKNKQIFVSKFDATFYSMLNGVFISINIMRNYRESIIRLVLVSTLPDRAYGKVCIGNKIGYHTVMWCVFCVLCSAFEFSHYEYMWCAYEMCAFWCGLMELTKPNGTTIDYTAKRGFG